ncbi:hypothetical protein [Halodesulfovibrio sp. MK-HDV]|jgi:hypothetical protein|uniref:hypothetical protein n=1 Tax=Halodesulfovibrio sp. MK-HDV TaxID=2599925 RepID=UPI00136BE44F|nr:hypothetical protein [Halodesulfovibrio sp. MK-HDV]KAF1075463.1 hypothetical protein MKHDV_01911 [Halodesulfovibrio sp. MK-HDV]
MGQSGKEIGQKYMHILQQYLNETTQLPVGSNGMLNMSKIAADAGVPRQSLYKNPRMKTLLEDARKSRGIPSLPAVKTASSKSSTGAVKSGAATEHPTKQRQMERRIIQLEQKNAVLVAENAELRQQLVALRQQMGREDMTIQTGRRIPEPPRHA